MELKYFTVEFKADSDSNNDLGSFSGYGSVFGNIDLGGDIVMPGAFAKSLQEWQTKQELPAMYGFHNGNNPIGDWKVMREDEKGLFVEGELWVKGDKRIEQAVVAHNIMRGTGPKGLSIGYRVKDSEMVEFQGGQVRQLKEVELFEVSVVGFAMNPQADVTAVKSMTDDEGNIKTKREVEGILRDAGMSRKQSKAFIAAGYDALNRDEEEQIDGGQQEADQESADLLKSLKQFSTILKGE